MERLDGDSGRTGGRGLRHGGGRGGEIELFFEKFIGLSGAVANILFYFPFRIGLFIVIGSIGPLCLSINFY